MVAFFGVGLAGAVLAFTIVTRLGGDAALFRAVTAYDLWVIASGVLGAGSALYLGRKWLGNAGPLGHGMAVVGILIVTLISGVCAGTLVLPLYGTMFGPFLIVVTLWAHPGLAVIWLLVLTSSHLLFAIYRRERASIFAAPPDTGLPV